VRQLVRQNTRLFLLATLSAFTLRVVFLWRFPAITADSFIYGDIAKNWLQRGIYGISAAHGVEPTFIRLPGYPAFLAAVFSLFGIEHYRAAMCVQIVFDLATCFLTADLARRLISPRSSKAAFLLAGLCPFLANYAAAALTETLEVFFTVLALTLAVSGLSALQEGRLLPWIGSGLSIGAAILLRPDGGLLLVAVGFYLLLLLLPSSKAWAGMPTPKASYVLRAGFVLAFAALAPLIPWTLRNQHTFHRFQPLAPRYANEENEFVPAGFNGWVKTWMADYVSVEEIYWAVPGGEMDASKLPDRAFDSAQQREQTEQLLADYNSVLHITPELDFRFAALADTRLHTHPVRCYVWLPLVRIADMWLRPRTEILPSDTRWWEFNDDPKWSVLAVTLGIVGLFYAVPGFLGIFRADLDGGAQLLLMFVVVRSLFLGTLENPEPRYTLEMYPALILALSSLFRGRERT
jgi:4-amino-4-deoxy-L-arabinose transferase-like glycosyltransferase